MPNLTCQNPNCKKEFYRRNSKRKYCSWECYIEVMYSDGYKNKGRFKKGEKPPKHAKPGDISMHKRKEWKYPRRFRKMEDGRWKLYASYLWEKHNGSIPRGMMVYFKDGDSFNDRDIDNLKLISFGEHTKISIRLKKLEMEEKPWLKNRIKV